MTYENTLITLFAVATAVAMAARWLNIPYTVALVAAGLGLGLTDVVQPPHLDKQLLYTLFLPGLLFEAAFHLEWRRFWGNILTIAGLALPGVIGSGFLMALLLLPAVAVLHASSGFSYGQALVFGALIAATDPIAVVGLFKSVGVPRRLAVLVEGESLVNDGTAVAFFGVVAASASGTGGSAWHGVLVFLWVVGVGIAAGVAVGFLVSRVIRRVDDPMIEMTLTTIAAWGSFVLGETAHASGVIATVCAGIICGNYAARVGMSATTRVALESFWEYVAFALNSIVFLLIGIEVHVRQLVASWRIIVVAYLIMTLARALLVGTMGAVLWPTRERLPWRWTAVLGWGGLRGALAMVLALSLARDFPNRALLVTITFGVVVLSILVQGLTMSPLLRRLGIGHRTEDGIDLARGNLEAARAALAALDTMPAEELPAGERVEAVRRDYVDRLRQADHALQEMKPREAASTAEQMLRRRLTVVEKAALRDAYRRGVIDRHARDLLLRERDERLSAEDGPLDEE